jgi:hypothetical protein
LSDKQFCSDDHRRSFRRSSARLVRDSAALGEMEDSWLVTAGDLARPNSSSSSNGFSIGSAMLLLTMALALTILLPRSNGDLPQNPVSYVAPSSAGNSISEKLSPGSISLQENFRADLRNWQGAASSARAGLDDWVVRAGATYPGQLKLWKPTIALADYQLQFETAIESKAVGWAVRASDTSNFYATKLLVTNSKSGDRAEVVRWAVIAGEMSNRVQLPIPISMETNTNYGVEVRVKGSRFTTFVNGQLVDTWTDERLRYGGVGFFSDGGERAALHWASINQREGFLNRLLHFGFFIARRCDSDPLGICLSGAPTSVPLGASAAR